MVKAMWKGATLAESDSTVIVEGNHYFPRSALDERFLRPSTLTTHCGWKGEAQYFDVVVDGCENPGAAWYYPDPKPDAVAILGRVAFWKGVEVV